VGAGRLFVLPEGISHFRIRRDVQELWDPERVLVVSRFSPTQPWTSHGAMARNAVISGLGRVLVVVDAGERGGTLAASLGALAANRPVIALEFSAIPKGNRMLIDRGAVAAASRSEFVDKLRTLSGSSQGNQLGFM
jgi:DNA processing protein